MRWALAGLIAASSLGAFERLDPKYQVRFGEGETEAVEYFSLSCRKCLEWYQKDFEEIRKEYLDTGRLSWVFHPTPADLPTLQMMVCLDRLKPEERLAFFQAVMESVAEHGPKESCRMMQAAMRALGHEAPELDKVEFLSGTAPFQDALEYLKQPDVVAIVPTLEIGGETLDCVPSKTILDEKMRKS